VSTMRRLLPVLALLGTLALPHVAHAGPQQLSVMMDDDNLVYRGDKVRDQTLQRMKALGVDEVRVTVLWSVVADGARRTKALDARFRRLGADNPRAYPAANWDKYDRLARACVTVRIGCYFDVTGPGPAWGHEKAPAAHRADQATWKPKPREFKLFVKALGKRYSGTYRDENDGKGPLARVSFWSIWNEPNQGGWLTPQWSGGKPYSPMLYRKLYVAGRQALAATGHDRDVILIGETAPLGNANRTTRSPMYPVTFIRSLFCIDAAGNRTNGPGCSDFAHTGPLQATAWAHHPYTKNVYPLTRNASPNAVTMADLGTLTGLLDQVAAKTGYLAPSLPVALTEFGFETNPPDPFSGISLANQATWNTLGDFISWANPRVLTNTQFLLKDVGPDRRHKKNTKAYWFTYQSGLFFNNGTPKPSAAAYALPFLAVPTATDPATGRPSYALWGQLRFRPNGAADTATLQYQPAGGAWAAVASIPVTDFHNYLTSTFTSPGPGQVRLHWEGPGALPIDSLPVPVG
jgi:hypothetical protein